MSVEDSQKWWTMMNKYSRNTACIIGLNSLLNILSKLDANLAWTLNPYFCKLDDDTKAFLDNLDSERDNRVVATYGVPGSDSSIVTRS